MNTDAPLLTVAVAAARVLEIQAKLHRWSTENPRRRFDDLDNLVADPAFLVIAWKRVQGNRGARTAGVDGQTARYITAERGEEHFLADIRDELRARTFRPLPVRERTLPKPGGKRRRLGIATVRDRVVQAALKLVLEPIFEAGSSRAVTASARGDGLMTQSPRFTISAPVPTSGCSREISRPASTRSSTGP